MRLPTYALRLLVTLLTLALCLPALAHLPLAPGGMAPDWDPTGPIRVENLYELHGEGGGSFRKGAVSRHTYYGGAAWVEAIADGIDHTRAFGFTNGGNDPALPNQDYAIILDIKGKASAVESGTRVGPVVTYRTGDVFRVAIAPVRSSTGEFEYAQIGYYCKGVLFHVSERTISQEDYPFQASVTLGAGDETTNANPRLEHLQHSVPVPEIIDFIMDDPDNLDDDYSAGDEISIVFSQATAAPTGGRTDKDLVDALFNFSHWDGFTHRADSLGADYSGSWTSASVFTITILDPTGATLRRFHTKATPAGIVPVASGICSTICTAATATSPTLWGDAGGRPISWENPTNVHLSGGSLTKSGGRVQGHDAGADGLYFVPGGGAYVEGWVEANDTLKILGFASEIIHGHTPKDVKIGVFLDHQGKVIVLYDGGPYAPAGPNVGDYSPRDIIRVSVESGLDGHGDAVVYVNDTERYRITSVIDMDDYPLQAIARVYSHGASIFDVKTNYLHAPVAADDAYTIDQDQILQIAPAGGLLANDVDADGGPLMVLPAFSGLVASHGLNYYNTDTIAGVRPYNGYLGLQADAPVLNPILPTYLVHDSYDPATYFAFHTSLNPINYFLNHTYFVPNYYLSSGVLVIDQTLQFAEHAGFVRAFLQPVESGVLVVGDDGSLVFDPHNDFSGEVTFAYLVTDGVFVDDGMVSITVTDVNHEPSAADNTLHVRRGGSSLLPFESLDPDWDEVTYEIQGVPAHGTITDGVYTAEDDWEGVLHLDYIARDAGGLASAPATITIVVSGWELPISVVGSSTNFVSFGMGISRVYTPIPPQPMLATARTFLGPSDFALARDIRQEAPYGLWILTGDARLSLSAATLTWDTSLIPDSGLYIVEVDPDNGELVGNIWNMSDTNSIEIAQGTLRMFEIRYGLEEFTLHLEPGWNLISLPVDPVDRRADTILDGIPAAEIWGWSGTAYSDVTTFEPSQGYWVFNGGDALDIEIIGLPLNLFNQYALVPEWNLTGVVTPPPFASTDARQTFANYQYIAAQWGWNGINYEEVLEFEAGQAYWVYVGYPWNSQSAIHSQYLASYPIHGYSLPHPYANEDFYYLHNLDYTYYFHHDYTLQFYTGYYLHYFHEFSDEYLVVPSPQR